MSDTEWTGEERRSIPIHILRYIDGRMDSFEDEVTCRFDKLEKQVKELSDSITSWMEKEPKACIEKAEKLIDEAIPHHPENPTATPAEKRHEHRKAHASWIAKVDEEMQRWKRIRENMISWALIGGAGFIAVAVWQHFLKGPIG